MEERTPNWGITPVPERLRVLGLFDTTLLWTNLGISLLVLVLPAYFDLSLKDALAATVVGGLATVLALLGPIGFVRRFVRKFAIWAVAASIVYLAWWIVDNANLGHLWSQPGAHHGSFWLGVDTVVAVTVSWAPLVADYTRFSRDRRSAFFGVGIGYLLPTFFQFGFGSILVLSRGVDPAHPELILTAIAGGGVAAALALLALTVDETDEAFANVYSCAVSVQNLVPRASQRTLIVGVSAVATVGALAIDMRSYQRFLLLLGAVFVPLLGVLLAHWLLSGARYTRSDIFRGPGIRLGSIFAWAAGFFLYEWLYQPADLGFWTRWLSHLPTPSYQFGASVPSFALAFVLAFAAGSLVSARAGGRPP